MKEFRPSPEITFAKLGLRSRGLWRGAEVEPAYSQLSQPARFRNALEELGGLYAAFGQFLCWRADLLRTDYIESLRQIRGTPAAVAVSEMERLLKSELGDKGAALTAGLEPYPCWNTLARCAYRTQYQGRTIVAQVARDPFPDGAFETLDKGLRLIEVGRVREVISPGVLTSFREWIRLSDSPARERAYLDALSAARERTLTQYPTVIPEISTERVLCLEWVEGEPVSERLSKGSTSTVERVAEYVLEQFCSVAAADADFDPDSMVLTPTGRLAIRRANRVAPVPPSAAQLCLQYISAVLVSNNTAAAQTLVKLCTGKSNQALESRLLDTLSNLEPELKVNLQFPPSVAVFEGNWRALTKSGAPKPLFLDILHRNLVAVGYWNASVAAPPFPAVDLIAGAQWPVLGRILRTELGDMASGATASDWFIGSGQLFFDMLRTMNRLSEGLRENDLAMGVDLQQDDDSTDVHHRIRVGILIGMLVVIFVTCLRYAVAWQGAWSNACIAVAIPAGVALFWLVSRFN